MRVLVAGSGDAFGSGGRLQTCIAVCDRAPPATVDQGVLLVDCGASSLAALRQANVDPQAVDAVAVTHLHGDHFAGLPFLVLDGQFRRRERDLQIVGPSGIRERLELSMEALFPGSTAVTRRFAVRVDEHPAGGPNSRDVSPIAGFAITAIPVRHAAGSPAYGLRVAAGEALLAYSGDTEWTSALIDVANGADLFLCEGYSHRRIRWHMCLEDLARHREQLGCARLVLTHMSAETLDPSADREHVWERAHDGWQTVLPSPGREAAERGLSPG